MGEEPDLLTTDEMYWAEKEIVKGIGTDESCVTALDFMVEKMTATPLNDSQRTELSNECRRVIEEPTKRGFRVKLII